MTAGDKTALLQSKLFKTLPTDFFENKVKIISVKKGEAVMTTGRFSRCLALIIRGRAKVEKLGLDGKRTVINTLREGEVFGMATLFYEEDEFPSEITAESTLRLAVFPKELIEEAFAVSPDFAKAYATLLSRKIHFLNKKISAFSEGEAPEKLMRWLLGAANGQKEFEIQCSLSQLAKMLGIGRASVYRAFDSLAQRGLIMKDGKKIVILKP